MKLENMACATGHGEAVFPRLRQITCEQSLLSKPDGSALFNHGDTSVLAAIYGPTEVKISKELIDQATVEVAFKPKVGLPGCAERSRERVLRNTCETAILSSLHPRTLISIVVQEMQNSGSFLACCINACCLALLDAAIPLQYMVAAVNCIIDQEGLLVLDPTHKHEKEATAHFTFVFDSQQQKIVTSVTKGSYSSDQYQQCLTMCQQASNDIFQFYRDAMQRKLMRV